MAMTTKTVAINTIDDYIATHPPHIQVKLDQMRVIIRKAAPKATEKISYGMPAFELEGNLVYFGGWKNHIGFYPMPSAINAFKKELSVFEGSKGAIKFPAGKSLPAGLITKMVKFRMKENLEKKKLKQLKKTTKK
jgi:uncharacterized protein YdhG (YjbR/CyaY superfamily)